MDMKEHPETPAPAGVPFWHDFGFNVFPIDKANRQPVGNVDAVPLAEDRSKAQARFDGHKDVGIGAIVPPRIVAFQASGRAESAELMQHLSQLNGPPMLITKTSGGRETAFYAVANGGYISALRAETPANLIFYSEGDVIELPTGLHFAPSRYHAKNIANLSEIAPTASQPAATATEQEPSGADPVVVGNPLEAYSLLGHASDVEALAKDTSPLFGNVVLSGQATIVYAPPGSGKTLLMLWFILQAIKEARVLGGNVYYMNADDSSSGAAAKVRLLEDAGAHSLVPGWRGFTPKRLVEHMETMAKADKCRGIVIIVDTLKKVVDTMDKRDSAAFGQAVRTCVARGATFVGLGHTRKNPSASGKLVHGGTTDLVEDADAACLLTPLDVCTPEGEKVVQFQFMKRRGDNRDEAYAYLSGGAASYEELIASVRPVDPERLDRFVAEAGERSDEPVIALVAECIGEGIGKKMLLADEVARRARVSTRAAIQVIERYQGSDPEKHRWDYTVQARGAKVYGLLTA